MIAGCVSIDITPDLGTPIGGNIREDNISRGIHDPLYANILYFNNSQNELLFVGLDIIGIHRAFGKAIKDRIHSIHRIPKEHIILFATHTHSGPDVMEAFKDGYHPLVQSYLKILEDKVVQGVHECKQNTWPAQLRLGKGVEYALSFNRRLIMKDGILRMNWEDIDPREVDRVAGPIDPELYVLTVHDRHDSIRAMLINFTLHPAVLVGKDWLFSRDYIHRLTEALQKELRHDLVVLFANGAEGNINHIDIKNPNQTRSFDEADRIGYALYKKVLKVFNDSQYFISNDINVCSVKIDLPRRSITGKEFNDALSLFHKTKGKIPSLLDGVPDEVYAKEIILLFKENKSKVTTELQAVHLGDTAIVCLPGEFFVEQGLAIKERSPYKHTMVFGLANDYIGYVPTEEAFEQGGYEVRTARTSQLAPHAGKIVVEKALSMLHLLRGGDC
ncbi:hypothetical protein J2S00_001090 [Caldalkalibacillus uzonensis]|uniref:Neutral/alkaline non-lysosomal ceramidase N-terminal domain-containing protein n=1 Tax=Caldalkalibacillus uzonensis TaxID=353224 RepID=A0ABU0CPH8_9BACI|nr:neutral/alkaline non-lysosomal ceramidase N-terminal domain-containing protein [Caldalkalibacillus uzonensis]MDQ0338306.1 hypothetical protein [Caldalkalibacillus uzonensis]